MDSDMSDETVSTFAWHEARIAVTRPTVPPALNVRYRILLIVSAVTHAWTSTFEPES